MENLTGWRRIGERHYEFISKDKSIKKIKLPKYAEALHPQEYINTKAAQSRIVLYERCSHGYRHFNFSKMGKKGVEFRIEGIIIESQKLFNDIVEDKLTPEEVLAIDNTDVRAVAFRYMDKSKMKDKLGEPFMSEKDERGCDMHLYKLEVNGEETILYEGIDPASNTPVYLNVHGATSPSQAKRMTFGLPENFEFINEW